MQQAALAAASSLAAVATAQSGGSILTAFFSNGVGGATPGFAGVGGNPYAEGGWTGPAPTKQEVGVVHGQEFVFSAPAVRRIGVDALDRLHRSAKAGAMYGYEQGGFVGATPFRGSTTSPRSAGGEPSVQVINNGAPVAAKAERTKAPDGRDLLRITLDAVAADVRGGAGPVSAAMKSRGVSLSGSLARRG